MIIYRLSNLVSSVIIPVTPSRSPMGGYEYDAGDARLGDVSGFSAAANGVLAVRVLTFNVSL
jgi:hypothetical protein